MLLKKVSLILWLLILFNLIACQNGTDSSNVQSTESYNMALIQLLDDEIQIIQNEKIKLALDTGDALFSLNWGNIKGRPDSTGVFTETGHAMAIAYSDSISEKPYFHMGGLDIGDMTLTTPDGSLDLNTIGGQRGGYVYISAPEGPFHGRRGKIEFEPMVVTFAPNFNYEFSVSGSTDFPAMNVVLQSPAAKLNIINLADGQAIDSTQDLQVNWDGASANSSIIVALLPFHNPDIMDGSISDHRRGHEKGRGAHGDRHGGPVQDPDFICLNINDHPAFIGNATSNTGTFTVSQQDIAGLVSSTNAQSLMLTVSALDESSETIDNLAINKIIRMNDRVVLNLQ